MFNNIYKKQLPMPNMEWYKLAFAYVSLGIFCGWYYIMCILYPLLLVCSLLGSQSSAIALLLFLTLAHMPLQYIHWDSIIYCFVFDIWKDYFNFKFDDNSIRGKIKADERYIYFQFPHGIFPMGEILSASIIRDVSPDKMICGTGADVIFSFPIMRHLMAWIGIRPASKQSIKKIFKEGHNCAIIPGGIAEMYLTNSEHEVIYLRKRLETIKLAIRHGAHIVPAYFFGNTKIFNVVGEGKRPFLAKLSRKIRASIIFFYGRQFLTVPYRHPIHLVFGEIIEVKQNDHPTDAEAHELMNRVIAVVEKLYKEKRPDWEDRPLVIL
jgi:diacylglycerol O-acyltransferase 2, plant